MSSRSSSSRHPTALRVDGPVEPQHLRSAVRLLIRVEFFVQDFREATNQEWRGHRLVVEESLVEQVDAVAGIRNHGLRKGVDVQPADNRACTSPRFRDLRFRGRFVRILAPRIHVHDKPAYRAYVFILDAPAHIEDAAIERRFHESWWKLVYRDEDARLAATETRPFGNGFVTSCPPDHRAAACPLGADFHDVTVRMQHGECFEDFHQPL